MQGSSLSNSAFAAYLPRHLSDLGCRLSPQELPYIAPQWVSFEEPQLTLNCAGVLLMAMLLVSFLGHPGRGVALSTIVGHRLCGSLG